MAPSQTPKPTPDPVEVLFKNRDDTANVEVRNEADQPSVVTIDIRSPRGIGAATLERRAEHWPDVLIVRWRLRSLESLRVSIEEVRYEGFVERETLKPHWSKQLGEEKPIELHPKDSTWCEIKIAGGEETKPRTIPLSEDQWLEMRIPKDWIQNHPKTIRFDWVDFHR